MRFIFYSSLVSLQLLSLLNIAFSQFELSHLSVSIQDIKHILCSSCCMHPLPTPIRSWFVSVLAFHYSSVLSLWVLSSNLPLSRLFSSIRCNLEAFWQSDFSGNAVSSSSWRVKRLPVGLSAPLEAGSNPVYWSLRLLTESESLLVSIMSFNLATQVERFGMSIFSKSKGTTKRLRHHPYYYYYYYYHHHHHHHHHHHC